jgi:ParB family chromosome partitioning protein
MNDTIRNIPMELVFPNPNQPRKDFDPEKLEELAMSIRQYGVLEPIVVTPRPFPGVGALTFDSMSKSGPDPAVAYMIVAGERRYRASLLSGTAEIPARIIEAGDALVEELALLENVQREDLNIIEEARAYQALLDRGWTREELARKMGFKQPWRIDERTNLLNLAPEYQRLVADGTIGHSQAFEMSRVGPSHQALILKKIRSGELGSYNKIRAFVDGLIAAQQQGCIFSFETITLEERSTIDSLESLIRSVERYITILDGDRAQDLKKAAFHSAVTPERLDLIIQHLMKIRKLVLAGTGVKTAIEAAA